MADQTIKGWTRREGVTGGDTVKVDPNLPVTISIAGAGSCDIIGYMVSTGGTDVEPIGRNKHVIETGATGDAAYNALTGFAEVGVENVVGVIDMEVRSGK
jgi:hypothetical protein